MIKTLKIIYSAHIAGLLLFAGVAYNKVQNPNSGNLVGDENLQTIAPVIGILLGIAGQFVSRFLIKDFKPSKFAIKEKYFEKYKTVKLIQWATIEAGALLNLTLYFMGGRDMNLYFGLGIILGIIPLFPSEKDLYSLFKITEKDLEEPPKTDDTF